MKYAGTGLALYLQSLHNAFEVINCRDYGIVSESIVSESIVSECIVSECIVSESIVSESIVSA